MLKPLSGWWAVVCLLSVRAAATTDECTLPDLGFEGTLNDDKCPQGWTCSLPHTVGSGGCGPNNGVYVGDAALTTASCNGCMTPSGNAADNDFFKIAWDNQCGWAKSNNFVLPSGTAKATFMVGGGADNGGFWLKRASDDSDVCSFTGPPQCPMAKRECVVPGGNDGTTVYIKLEKPAPCANGGWENLVFDDIKFENSGGTELEILTGCSGPAIASCDQCLTHRECNVACAAADRHCFVKSGSGGAIALIGTYNTVYEYVDTVPNGMQECPDKAGRYNVA